MVTIRWPRWPAGARLGRATGRAASFGQASKRLVRRAPRNDPAARTTRPPRPRSWNPRWPC